MRFQKEILTSTSNERHEYRITLIWDIFLGSQFGSHAHLTYAEFLWVNVCDTMIKKSRKLMAVRCPTLGPRCRQIHRKSLGNRSSQSRSAITYSLITYLFLIFSSTDVYLMLSLSNFLRNQTVFMGVAISVLVLEQPLKNRAFFHVGLV